MLLTVKASLSPDRTLKSSFLFKTTPHAIGFHH